MSVPLGLREEIVPEHRAFLDKFKDRPGRLLDVGCGDGVFLREAQKYGFEVWRTDFDRKSVKVAQEKWGLKNVFAMSLDEFAEFAKEKDLKFDYITFFEVLEHQDNPKGFLEKVKTLLKDGGYVAGSVPNRESLLTKLAKRGSCGDFPPYHFLRFSKKALMNALKSKGFNEIYISDTRCGNLGLIGQILLTGGFAGKLNVRISKLILFFNNKSREVRMYRIKIFKLLRNIRNLVFLPIGLIGTLISQGNVLYFQAKS